MSTFTRRSLGTAALLLAALGAQAQDIKFGANIHIWYTQMLDNALRSNSNSLATTAGNRSYYNLRSEFKENGFQVRRVELTMSGKVMEGLEYNVMFDPSLSTSTANPNIVQDAYLTWKPVPALEVRAGQMKNLQTYEGILVGASELLFTDRSQLGRVIGDVRDRGVSVAYTLGEPKTFAAKMTVAVFNGGSATTKTLNKDGSITGTTYGIVKASDSNAQKDFVLRLDMNLGTRHRFGAYTLQGATDYADRSSNPLVARPFTRGDAAQIPTADQVKDNKDKTTSLGAYYVFQLPNWHFSAEVVTGLLGRRFPTLENTKTSDYGTTSLPAAWSVDTAAREHLDQKFLGWYLTGAYITGPHSFLARYDVMDYNSNKRWYTTYNPYTTWTDGTPLLGVNGGAVDYTPKYTEATLGYTYAFKPEKIKSANLKINYIHRSKNFLAPLAGTGETGEKGGDTLMAAFQIAF